MDKRKVTRRQVVIGGMAGIGSLVSWPLIRVAEAQTKAVHTMILAHTFSDATEQYVVTGINQFKQAAEKYSQGKLFVDVHDSGKLGGQNVLPQKVQQGAIQACQLSMQNFTPFSESFNVLDFPFLFASNDAFERFLQSPYLIQSKLATEPATKGFRLLPGLWANTGLRVFGVSKKVNRDVHVPSDLKGLKIRVTSSKIEQQAFGLTPGNPVSVDWAETYQAMQQGAVDALNVGLGPLSSARIQETIGTVTRLGMSFNAHVVVVGKRWFDALPPDVREAIDRAATEAWKYEQTEQVKANDRMWSEWKALGIKVIDLTPEERKQWVAAVGHQRPEWDKWKERYGRDLYQRVAEFGQKTA
jgi:C4-dicarboxylate-binding protein DctP